MRPFTDQEIIARVEGLPSFHGWDDGEYEIWIRSAADAFNLFDDKGFHFSVSNGVPTFVSARTGTTNAGSYGLLDFAQYNHDGCAVLKGDQMIYNSHIHGLHHGKEAYIQAKPFPFFRDNNRNQKAEEIGPEHDNEIIGANIHRAGVDSTVINNWSTGCVVTNVLTEYLAFLAYMDGKGHPPVTLCILKEWPAATA